jgi:hypothetical protein
MRRWAIFLHERFSPSQYVPLLALYFLSLLYFTQSLSSSQDPQSLLALWSVVLSFFLRLRLFDELKDFSFDCQHNPQRPLARGLLSVDQVRSALLGLIVFECLLMKIYFSSFFYHYLSVVFYSLLMFEEFFIGKWLRPHLTTYAVFHTFVVFLLSLTVSYGLKGSLEGQKVFAFSALHWFLFNYFEFARKTFSSTEERVEVTTYTSLFGWRGALFLCLTQLVLVYLCVDYFLHDLYYFKIICGLCILSLTPWFFMGDTKAKLFRTLCTLHLGLLYVFLNISFYQIA